MTQKLNFTFKEFLAEIYDKPAKLNAAYHSFHNYSLGNAMLAMMQLGKAEPINTYKGWLALGRQVSKGSKAIALLMPITIKDKEDETKTFTHFIERFNWFGYSQTSGEAVTFDNIPDFSIETALQNLGITKKDFAMVNGNCQGYARPTLKEIAINPIAFAPFKTTCHEIAHCLLHGDVAEFSDSDNLESSVKEFEAEATAYLVCCALDKTENLESSRAYIAGWLKRDDAQEKMFKRAFTAANKILQAGKSSQG